MISEASQPVHPIRTGIVGLGRSGWNIHAKTLAALPKHFRVSAVTDPESERCLEARQGLGCRIYNDFAEIINDDALDLIVIASPNHLHTDQAIQAMAAGKHVVCEKPFALSIEDADRAIAAAEAYDRVLSPFQHRRYESHFLKVQEIIESGALGRIVQVRMVWHQFTRRWDWQTLRRFGGGLLNNNGSHLMDHALQLLPPDVEPDVCADLKQVLTLGDTEDHIKIVMKAEGCPTLDVELSNAVAYPQDRWLIKGDRGGLRGTPEHLQWRTMDWDALPPRRLETAAATGREYSKDDITWTEHTWSPPADEPSAYERYYQDLYTTIRTGQPLAIQPQSVRRLIRVLERCYEQCDVMPASPTSL
ncbi:Gfo/Idh/MocA family protein [Algisphaera agarilytica]|uniref:Putative dehydrogenase n=1 Tax=Algisphaera agarilytica TaxID=1385975 RepID=A0A7X0H351_9BACT|nr:Gfo/Idh/MocA family oxidoreductase [Algisphaera agarilytica]MBB6428396.1 putative dehydrogenase [Algisphaera agarilytica]